MYDIYRRGEKESSGWSRELMVRCWKSCSLIRSDVIKGGLELEPWILITTMAQKVFWSPKSEKILLSNPSIFPGLRRLQSMFRLCVVILAGKFEWIHSAAELRDDGVDVYVAQGGRTLMSAAPSPPTEAIITWILLSCSPICTNTPQSAKCTLRARERQK